MQTMKRLLCNARALQREAEETLATMRGELERDEHVPSCGRYGCDGTPGGHARAARATTRGAS